MALCTICGTQEYEGWVVDGEHTDKGYCVAALKKKVSDQSCIMEGLSQISESVDALNETMKHVVNELHELNNEVKLGKGS